MLPKPEAKAPVQLFTYSSISTKTPSLNVPGVPVCLVNESAPRRDPKTSTCPAEPSAQVIGVDDENEVETLEPCVLVASTVTAAWAGAARVAVASAVARKRLNFVIWTPFT